MRVFAVVATVAMIGSVEALSLRRKPGQACGSCPAGVACSSSCSTSTIKTVTKCTTCTKTQQVSAPKAVAYVGNPVTYEIVQKPVTAYVLKKPAPCPCSTQACGPCQPVMQITCSVACRAANCIPCPPASSSFAQTVLPAQPSGPAQPVVPVPPAPASKTTVVVDKRLNQPSAEILVDGNGLVSVGGKIINA